MSLEPSILVDDSADCVASQGVVSLSSGIYMLGVSIDDEVVSSVPCISSAGGIFSAASLLDDSNDIQQSMSFISTSVGAVFARTNPLYHYSTPALSGDNSFLYVDGFYIDFFADHTLHYLYRDITFVSRINGPDIIAYEWSFGDGETSTDANPVHHYSQLGVYAVALTVTTASGDNVEVKKTHYITIEVDPAMTNIDKLLRIAGACNDASQHDVENLQNEMFPQTCTSSVSNPNGLLEQYEAEYAIVSPIGATLTERRQAVLAKITAVGDDSFHGFYAVAGALGYTKGTTSDTGTKRILIKDGEYVAFRADISGADDYVYDGETGKTENTVSIYGDEVATDTVLQSSFAWLKMPGIEFVYINY